MHSCQSMYDGYILQQIDRIHVVDWSFMKSSSLLLVRRYQASTGEGRRVKPTFHQNASLFTLGRQVGFDPQRDHFALLIQTSWYLETLADSRRDSM